MTLGDLIFIFSFLGVVVAIVRLIYLAVRRKQERLTRGTKGLAIFLVIYCVALFIAGAVGHAKQLAFREDKCFDDWCITLSKANSTTDGYDLSFVANNRGRRPQRPDTPRIFLDVDGRRERIADPQFQNQVGGHESTDIQVHVQVPASAKEVRVIATEGGFPSPIVIGDENGPLHPKSYWQVKG